MMEPYHIEPETYEWRTTITSVKDGKFVTLAKSYFYPNGGGQPWDEGAITTAQASYPVVFVGKFGGKISHEVDPEGKPALQEGASVTCVIDKERRKRLMRSHTAAHIVSAIIHKETGAEITGNQLSMEKVRIDFSTPNYDPEAFKRYIDEANTIIAKDLPVHSTEVDRSELTDDSVFKLAKGFPDHITKLRILEIPGVDKQACGGTHMQKTGGIGRLELIKVENKGAKNRRVYFRLLD